MSQVFVDCPKTGEAVYIGLNFDWFSFDSTRIATKPFRCPRCGENHDWTQRDAYLRADGGEG